MFNHTHNTKKKNQVNIPCLPFDEGAEHQVLAGCFYPGGLEKALEILCAEDFLTLTGKKIFTTLENLHKTGRPVSIGLVERSLAGDPDYSKLLSFLEKLIPFTAESVTHFSKIVYELSQRRQMMRAAEKAIESLEDCTISIPEAAKELLKIANGIKEEGERNG